MGMRPKLREVLALREAEVRSLKGQLLPTRCTFNRSTLQDWNCGLERRNSELVDALAALVSLHDCAALTDNTRCPRVKCAVCDARTLLSK